MSQLERFCQQACSGARSQLINIPVLLKSRVQVYSTTLEDQSRASFDDTYLRACIESHVCPRVVPRFQGRRACGGPSGVQWHMLPKHAQFVL